MSCPPQTRAVRPSVVILLRVFAVAAAACLAAGCLGAPEPSPTGPATRPTSAPTPSPTPTASPSPVPTPRPTPYPTPVPTPTPVAAVSNGVWIPASQAERATRHPMAVMIDDAAAARPQSGLAYADVFYQALAEGGIPRYMAVFQASDPPTVGPVRSARLYYVAWAKEWRALYAHAGGAPNAMAAIAAANRKTLWDIHHGRYPRTLYRVSHRYAPHNVYSTAKLLRRLGKRLGATEPFTTPLWTFKEPAGMADRPRGGSIVVPYRANRITYRYDRASNRYVRGVTGAQTQRDGTSRKVVAPTNVVVLFMTTGQLANDALSNTNIKKHRLDIDYLGTGKALVFRDGTVVKATWSKKGETAPTRLLYASGPLKGQPVPLVRGQIAIQVVPKGTDVTWKLGRPAPVPERAN